MEVKMDIIVIEILGPTLSTITADNRSPGSSGKDCSKIMSIEQDVFSANTRSGHQAFLPAKLVINTLTYRLASRAYSKSRRVEPHLACSLFNSDVSNITP